MSNLQQDRFANEHEPALGEGGERGGAPGKRSMTQGMSPRAIIFRVESAEAARELGAAFGPRDRNGVAANADAAVDRAAGGSGAPLRDDLRQRFESSLGTDLSSVRVHTGGDSAEASSAVGAKAYTVGNDIHFGAGHYQPDDPFGMHLIAHEVAHTQQQAGGATHRQHKLEVSTPGDSAEVEADRAADAMVAGQAATVGSASGLAREKAADDKAAAPPSTGAFSLSKGPLSVEFSASTDGKCSVSGGGSVSGGVETGIPGVFVEGEFSAKFIGEAAIAADGSATGSFGSEIAGQVTLNGGVQKVASVYGGANLAIKIPGATVTRSAAGVWSAELGSTISLVGKLVAGVKAEALEMFKDSLPAGWDTAYKYEISPGGEQELLVYNTKTGKFSQGKDVAALVAKINAALNAVGIGDQPKLKKLGSGVTDVVNKAAAEARAKREAEERRLREAQNAVDRKEYDEANNPAYQQSGGERNPLDELDSCEMPPE